MILSEYIWGWRSADVVSALVSHYPRPFDFRKNLVVAPNVSWGFGLKYEADLLVVSKRHYLTEIEVKVSRSDFRADEKKRKHTLGLHPKVKRFYYAMPENVWERCTDVWRVPGSGVYVTSFDKNGDPRAKLVMEAKHREVEPLTDDEVLKLMRLASMRIWKR